MTYDIDIEITKYSTTVYRTAYAYVAHRQDAEDVMQEVFLRFVRKQPNFTSDEHKKAWFLRVTSNCAKTALSRRNKNRTVNIDTTENLVVQFTEENDYSPLYHAVLSLPPKQRLCIHLYYFEGYKTAQIAKITSMGEATVKSNLCRARQTLKEKLKGVYTDEYLEEI